MTVTSSSEDSHSHDDPVLDAFFRALDAALGTDAVADVKRDFSARYPNRAEEFSFHVRMRENFDAAVARQSPCDPGPPPTMPSKLGKFRIVRWIGRGGMGDIYEAVQESLGRRVAIKTLRGTGPRLTGSLHNRFMREQTMLAKFHHTHIVPIYDAGIEGDIRFFAMQYIEGASLDKIVDVARLHAFSTPLHDTPPLSELAVQARTRRGNHASSASEEHAHSSATATIEQLTQPWSPITDEGTLLDQQGSRAIPSRKQQIRFSERYVRSVVQAVIDVAEAIQHAHEFGFLHRDIKPSNLMIECRSTKPPSSSNGGTVHISRGQMTSQKPPPGREHCWVLDFGLGGYLRQAREEADENRSGEVLTSHRQSEVTAPTDQPGVTASGILGTLHYMAPEQFEERADARTDVWGLGILLYELLSLRPAFEPFRGVPRQEVVQKSKDLITNTEPPPPHTLVKHLPRDLSAICQKALQKKPDGRYPTAAAFAEDLKRWLRGEPVSARRASRMRRVWMWSKREKGSAFAIVTVALTILSLGVGGLALGNRIAAAEKAEKEKVRAYARTTEAQRDSAIQKQRSEMDARLRSDVDRLLSASHSAGWRSTVEGKLSQLSRNDKDKNDLRPVAFAMLSGLDATEEKTLPFASSLLTFDATGRSLYALWHEDRSIRVYDRETDQTRVLPIKGHGPIGFDAERTPLLLTRPDDDDRAIALIDLNQMAERARFVSPDPERPLIQAVSIARDRAVIAALCRKSQSTDPKQPITDEPTPLPLFLIAVWDAHTGELLKQIEHQADDRDIALAPDGSLLVVAREPGTITVWTLPDGVLYADLPACDNPIQCMDFGPDPLSSEQDNPATPRWQLAVGDRGGIATVLDLRQKRIRMLGRATSGDFKAIAFNHDGTLVAACGRGTVRIFDAATGRPALTIVEGNILHALAFSPDGCHLAVGRKGAFGDPPDGTLVYSLSDGRGIHTLPGLTGRTARIAFSRSGKFMAALSDAWKVGVWDTETGSLLQIFRVEPFFEFTDNAGMALDDDGRLAFCAGALATLWDIKTGQLLRRWKLPPGMGNRLDFHEEARLTLFRWEAKTGVPPVRPYLDPLGAHPIVYRFYNLLDETHEKPTPFAEHNDHNGYNLDTELDAAGRHVVVGGFRLEDGTRAYSFIAFDARTGAKLWEHPRPPDSRLNIADIQLDPTGSLLVIGQLDLEKTRTARASVFSMPDGRWIADREWGPHAMAPGASAWFEARGGSYPEKHGFCLYPEGHHGPMVRLYDGRAGGENLPSAIAFAPNPRFAAWGNPDGSLSYVDLVELQKAMAAHSLGW